MFSEDLSDKNPVLVVQRVLIKDRKQIGVR